MKTLYIYVTIIMMEIVVTGSKQPQSPVNITH